MSTCVKPGFNSVTGRVQTERLLRNWWRFVDRTHTADTFVLIRKMELCDTEKDVSLPTVGGSLHKSWKCFVANMFILPVLHEGAENTDEKWMRFLFCLLNMPRFKQSNCVFSSTKCMGNGVYFQRRMSVCSWTRVLITAPTPKDPSNVPVTEITKTSMATV